MSLIYHTGEKKKKPTNKQKTYPFLTIHLPLYKLDIQT